MKYILRILLVLVIVCLFASLIYEVLSKGQSQYRNGYAKYKEMFVDSTLYDVVLIGSSRTHRNINTQICDSVTKLSFYNAGISGARFYEISTVFHAFFYTHPPVTKYLIYNIDDLRFSTDNKFYNPTLYFDFFENAEIYNAFKNKKYPVWCYKNLSFTRILEYNDDLRNNSLKGLTGEVNPEDLGYKGFCKMPVHKFKKTNFGGGRIDSVPDYSRNNSLKSILTFCKKNHIKVIFIISPIYDNYYNKRTSNFDELVFNFEIFANKENALFWRFDKISLCYNEEYFTDFNHLNEKGADIFSAILSKEVNKLSK